MNRSKCLIALRPSSLHQVWRHLWTGSSNRSTATAYKKPFPPLPDTLDVDVPEVKAAAQVAQKHLAKLAQLKQQVAMGGGEKARSSHVRHKVLPYDRIARILDGPLEDVLWLGTFAGLGMPYGDVPSANVITCIGKVHNRFCLIVSFESTFKGGSTFPITTVKTILELKKSERCGLPFIIFTDSAGAFLPLQAEIYPDVTGGGKVFNMEPVLAAKGLLSLGIICGSCTAGGAYGPTLCQEAIIVDQTGTLFLGGPPLVKAALGEEIDAQSLGGADVHCRMSGVTDYFAVDETESFEMIRDAIATTNYSSDILQCPTGDLPLYPTAHLDSLCGLSSLTKEQILGVISRVVDGSRFRQFKALYGRHLITGYASIQGRMVGIVANFGSLTFEDGLKGSHFLQICQLRDLPVIFMQNSAVDKSSKLEARDEAAALKGRAAMAAAVACLTSPKISLNISGCCSDDAFTMCGPSFDPWFTFSWPSGFLLYDHNNFDTDEAIELLTKRADVTSSKTDTETATSSSKKSKPNVLVPGSCWYDASHMLTDEVIAPSLTREVLSKTLEVCAQRTKLIFQDQPSPVYRH